MAPRSSLKGAKNSGAIHCLEREPISHRIRKTAIDAAPRQNSGLESTFFNASPLLFASLEGLERLLAHRVVGFVDQLAEALRGEHAVVARVRDVDVEDLLRLARTGGHDRDAGAEEYRPLKIVG